MLVIAAAVLVAGVGLFALLTTPDEIQAVPETTTTTRPGPPPTRPTLEDVDAFSVEQIETGSQPEWIPTGAVGSFFPYDLVRHDKFYYVLSSTTAQWDRQPGGLMVWRSTNGSDWVTVGEVIDDTHKISAVAATPRGLVAVEPTDSGFTVWRSNDGETWSPEPVDVDNEDGLGVIYPQTVGGTDRLLVVHGHVFHEPIALLEQAIEKTHGTTIDLTQYGFSPQFGADDTTYVVHGPLGIPILTVSANDMDLTDEQRQLLQYGPGDRGSTVWASWDGADWSQGRLEDLTWMSSMVPRNDGSLLAVGWGNTGANMWVSYDGLIWDEERVHPEPSTIEHWGDGFVGPDSIGDASILTSTDGIEWVETGVEQHLPRPIGWQIDSIAAGEAGIAAAVTGWRNDRGFDSDEMPEPPVLSDGDLTVTIDLQPGHIRVVYGDQTRELGMWASSLPEGMSVDLEKERIIFFDPESGEEWGSFSFDDLRRAEESYWHGGLRVSHPVFVYSKDGRVWNVQGLADQFGAERPRITAMEMTEDGTVLALVTSDSQDTFRAAPGFEIWAAKLP